MFKGISRRDFLKGAAVFSVAAGSAGILTACGSSSSSTGSSSESGENSAITESTGETTVEATSSGEQIVNEITVAVPAAVETLNPYRMSDEGRNYILPLAYQTLTWYNGQEHVNQLAKEITEVDDLHWDVEIYDYITDSDGNNVTASDVVFSFNWLIDNNQETSFESFESVEEIDDYVVRFTWAKEITGLSDLEFVLGRTAIFTEQAYNDHNFTVESCGTGPYVVTEFTSGSSATLEARDDYWQTDELTLEKDIRNIGTIHYDFITEASQRIMALETGSVDFVANADEDSVSAFEDGGKYADDFNVDETASEMIYSITPNVNSGSTDGKLSDINLRLAIFYSLNNNAIAATVSGAVAAETIGNSYYVEYDESWTENETYINTMDLDLAEQYLEASDYDGKELVIACDTTEAAKNIAQVIQSQMAQININSTILSQESDLNRTLTQSTEGWDLKIGWSGSGGLLSSAMRGLAAQSDTRNGMSPQMVVDDEMEALYQVANSIDGHSSESVKELIDYLIDNAYVYTPIVITTPTVYSVKFATLYYDTGTHILVPGACTYN